MGCVAPRVFPRIISSQAGCCVVRLLQRAQHLSGALLNLWQISFGQKLIYSPYEHCSCGVVMRLRVNSVLPRCLVSSRCKYSLKNIHDMTLRNNSCSAVTQFEKLAGFDLTDLRCTGHDLEQENLCRFQNALMPSVKQWVEQPV